MFPSRHLSQKYFLHFKIYLFYSIMMETDPPWRGIPPPPSTIVFNDDSPKSEQDLSKKVFGTDLGKKIITG
jgi:hypothetical protein